MTAAVATRRHDIDALRVLAFALLILYHVGMFYVADWGWHVKSAYLAEWLQYPMLVVNRWRMPLLFLVSGLAVNFLLRRARAGEFAWARVKRLLVPLAFGMAVVVPPQAYAQAMANGAFAGNYFQFLYAYFTFQPWPAGAFDGSHVGVTWNHLWYLPYVLAYSLLLAAVLPLLESPAGSWLRKRFQQLRGMQLVLLPVLPLLFGEWLLDFPSAHDLITDWENHAKYFTVFLYGWWMGANADFWAELKTRRRMLLGLALLSLAGFLLLNRILLYTSPWWQRMAYDVFEYLYQWSALLTVLAWGHHLLNKPFRWLPYATEAVFSWYVLHQTVTVVAGWQLAKLALGPVIEPALVLFLTLAGCAVLHEFIVRRVRWLRPLFGLKPEHAHPRMLRVAAGVR